MYRKTNETEIEIKTSDSIKINTGIGFFNHMLELMLFRAGIYLEINAKGDLEVDNHHTIEDVGITLGNFIAEMLGNKSGIVRYGSARVPMDESLAEVTVDLDISGRPFLVFNAELANEDIEEFFRAFAMNSKITLHINLLYGKNSHHKAEAIFKATGLALKQAMQKQDGITSTKGMI